MSFAEGLVVRALRGAAAFAAFFAFGRFAPGLFEASGALVVEGRAPVAVSVWDGDAARAAAARDAALARASGQLGTALGGSSAPGATPAAGVAPLDRLVEFVALHPELPEVLSRPPPVRANPTDTDRIRLERERDRVQADLAAFARGAPPESSDSDNPFGGDAPAPSSDKRLKLRLAEIDASLAALERLPAPAAATNLRTELASLLSAVPETAAPDPKPLAPRASVSVVRGGVVPREPDRRSLLAVGLLAALGAALLPTRRRPSRPRDELDDIVPGASKGLVLSPLPTFDDDEVGPEGPPARSLGPAVESMAYPPVAPATPVPAPALGHPYDEPVVASARPRSAPPVGESPVMAYPVPWRADSVGGRDRFPELRKAFLGEAARDCFVVAISATASAAKSRAEVAAALAAAFADDPMARVLAVEADLGAPALGAALGLEVLPTTDFGKQLGARVEGSADGHWYVLKCSPALHVLAAKAVAPELVLSTHFEDCVAALRPFYDVIILRAPAVSDAVACRAVADVIDGVVVLVSEGDGPQESSPGLSLFGSKRLALELPI